MRFWMCCVYALTKWRPFSCPCVHRLPCWMPNINIFYLIKRLNQKFYMPLISFLIPSVMEMCLLLYYLWMLCWLCVVKNYCTRVVSLLHDFDIILLHFHCFITLMFYFFKWWLCHEMRSVSFYKLLVFSILVQYIPWCLCIGQ